MAKGQPRKLGQRLPLIKEARVGIKEVSGWEVA
jgi:hypothetical protein